MAKDQNTSIGSFAELAPDVTEYARTRDSDYQQHLGVVSLVRKDLEMFAAILANSTAGPGGTAAKE